MEALVVVDMQNCFAAEGGLIFLKQAKEQIPYIKKTIQQFKAEKKPVVYLAVVWDAVAKIPTGLVNKIPGNADLQNEAGLGRGRWGAKYVSELEGLSDYYVEKQGFDGFHDSELDTLLRRLGVDTVYIVGTTANNCVYATALGAFQRGYKIIALRDGISSFTEEDRGMFLGNIDSYLGHVK
jgi:ureidoacrylate peracid hydrolase